MDAEEFKIIERSSNRADDLQEKLLKVMPEEQRMIGSEKITNLWKEKKRLTGKPYAVHSSAKIKKNDICV